MLIVASLLAFNRGPGSIPITREITGCSRPVCLPIPLSLCWETIGTRRSSKLGQLNETWPTTGAFVGGNTIVNVIRFRQTLRVIDARCLANRVPSAN